MPGGDKKFLEIYKALNTAYGDRGWWPVSAGGSPKPRYAGGPRNDRQRFEVAVGAVLTQNTGWKNAEAAIVNLNRENLLNPDDLSEMPEKRIARIIRPAGYYNQKARRLKLMAHFFREETAISRNALLELKGIGPETADSIMLYAFDEPVFVIDSYTRRIFGRLGMIDPGLSYEELRRKFEASLPRKTGLYKQFHALIVEHAKRMCRSRPICGGCTIADTCRTAAVKGG